MPVLPRLICFGFISRFSAPAMTLIAAVATVATVAKKMQADEHNPDKDPNPVLCKPCHLSLPLRDCESIFG